MTEKKGGRNPKSFSSGEEVKSKRTKRILLKDLSSPKVSEALQDFENAEYEECQISKEDQLRESCRFECQLLLRECQILGLPLCMGNKESIEDKVPKIIATAIKKSEAENQRKQVVEFCRTWGLESLVSHEDYKKKQIFSLVADADAGIFFPWCRKPLFDAGDAKTVRQTLIDFMENRLPCRSVLSQKLCDFVIRRILGDQSALSPVLCGPPGSGKTQAVLDLAAALNASGLRTGFVHHPMNQAACGEKNEETAGRLLGTGKQWSNATSGQIYNAGRQNDLVLVFLDEAEKGGNRDFLVALLDPQQPLWDNFIHDLVGQGDLRYKTFFVLAVNDYSGLNRGNGDPLWSRLDPVDVPPYSEEDMVTILARRNFAEARPFAADSAKIEALTRKAIQILGAQASFRRVESLVNDMLYRHMILGESEGSISRCSSQVISFPVPKHTH